jgi:ATP-dependent RNA helicase DDX52/ROK1
VVEMRQMARTGGLAPPVLVFTQATDRAAHLARALRLEGIEAAAVHSGLPPHAREENVRAFRRGDAWCLVATDVLGRGLDFPAVRTVVNYDLPQTPEMYVHRVGRTGRAGVRGTAVTFFTEQDLPYLRPIANVVRESGGAVPSWMLQLAKAPRSERRRLRTVAPRRKGIDAIVGVDGRKANMQQKRRDRAAKDRSVEDKQ